MYLNKKGKGKDEKRKMKPRPAFSWQVACFFPGADDKRGQGFEQERVPEP